MTFTFDLETWLKVTLHSLTHKHLVWSMNYKGQCGVWTIKGKQESKTVQTKIQRSAMNFTFNPETWFKVHIFCQKAFSLRINQIWLKGLDKDSTQHWLQIDLLWTWTDLKIWFKVIAYQMAYVWDGLSHGKIKYVLYKWWQIDGLIYHP